MKKITYIFLIIIGFSGFVNAQNTDNCRFQINKTDEFTGEHILVTTSTKVNTPRKGDYQFAFSFANIIDRDNLLPPSKFINIKLSSVNESLFIGKGDPVLIKLNNNEIIELLADDDFRTDMKTIAPNRTLTQVIAKYEVSNDDLVKIKQFGISKILLNTSKSQINLELQKKDNHKINKMLNCVVDI